MRDEWHALMKDCEDEDLWFKLVISDNPPHIELSCLTATVLGTECSQTKTPC